MDIINTLLLLMCFIVPLVAAGRSNIFLINPMSLLAIQVFVGVTIKGMLIIWGGESFTASLRYWVELESLSEAIAYVSFFILLLVAAYSLRKKPYPKDDMYEAMLFSNERPFHIKRTIVFCLITFVSAFFIFLAQKGSVVSSISQLFTFDGFHLLQRNRSVRIDSSLNFGATHAATSLFFKLGLFLFISSITVLYLGKNGSVIGRNRFWFKFALVLSGLLIILEVLVTGRRTFLAVYILLSVGITSMWSWRDFFSYKKLVGYGLLFVVLVFLFALLTQARIGESGNIASYGIFDSVLHGEYLISISKLTVFVNGASSVGLLYGASFLDWVGGLVPRFLWENKPVVSLGPFVRAEYYGYSTGISGIPPTIIGESFLNFGWFGLSIAPIIGVALRKFENYFLSPVKIARHDGHIWYFLLIFPVSYNMYQSSFSAAVINLVSQGILLAIFFLLLRGMAKKQYTQ